MKKFKPILLTITFVFINLFFLTKPSYAMCRAESIDAIQGPDSIISDGSILLITHSPKGMDSMWSLESGKHKIPLKVLYSNNSEILMKPLKQLENGRSYTIFSRGVSTRAHWIPKATRNKKIEPIFTENPLFKKFENNNGCGGSLDANFAFKTKGASFLFAELTDVKSGIIQTQILTNRKSVKSEKNHKWILSDFDGGTSISEYSCGGGVIFKPATEYKARFKAIGVDGKESVFTDYVPFKSLDSFEVPGLITKRYDDKETDIAKPSIWRKFWNRIFD